jgi:hypothetical protein
MERMHLQQENQTDFNFNFHETQNFKPDYIPEVVAPAYFDKEIITRYSKQSWLKRFFTLPKVSTFVLESLGKSYDFSNDLSNSLKQVETRVDRLNDKFSVLESMQGDFQTIMMRQAALSEKLQKIEMNEGDILALRQETRLLVKKNRIILAMMFLLMILNAGFIYYFMTMS